MNKYIAIFGSTGRIGTEVCKLLKKEGIHVIGIGRSINSSCSSSIKADFINYESLFQELKGLTAINISAVVFCHRYRIKGNKELSEDFTECMNIEMNPFLAIKQYLDSSNTFTGPINIVTVTSNASRRWAIDVDYAYHIIKSAQLTAGLALGALENDRSTFSNAISIGEVVDNRIGTHSNYHETLYKNISSCLQIQSMTNINNIARAVLILCSADKLAMNGQILNIDSGLSSITQESIIRINSRTSLGES